MGLTVTFDVDGCEGTFTSAAGLSSKARWLFGLGVAAICAAFMAFGLLALLPLIVVGFVVWQVFMGLYAAAPSTMEFLLHEENATFEVRGTTLSIDRPSGATTHELVGMRVVSSPLQIDLYGAMGATVTLPGETGDEEAVARLAEALTKLAARQGSRRAEVPEALEGLSTRRT